MLSQLVLRSYARPCSLRIGLTTRRTVGIVRAEKQVRCYVNEEGHLVCDRLDAGDYVVKKAHDEESLQDGKPPEGAAYCYITDSGELICEGLPEGNYTIEQASDEHIADMVSQLQALTEDKTEEESVESQQTEDAIKEESYDPETGVRCYVNSDGVMVCEKLEPGDYFVKSLSGSKEASKESEEEEAVYCYITDSGELLCKGIKEGQYTIEKATDDDMEKVLKHIDRINKESE